MIAGMFSTASVGAQELNPATNPISVTTTTDSSSKEVAETPRIPKDTVVDWEKEKQFNLPADRVETDSLTVTAKIGSTEEVSAEDVEKINKDSDWTVEVNGEDLTYTAKKELIELVNKKVYTENSGTETFNVEVKEVERVRKETETYEVDVKKTREVKEEVPVTKTRMVNKEVTEKTTDYTKAPLNIAYILDTSSSRTNILPLAKSGIEGFVNGLDPNLVAFYGESYSTPVDGDFSARNAWVPTRNSVTVPEAGRNESTYRLTQVSPGDGADDFNRIKTIVEALKAQHSDRETIVVIESDFNDYSSQTATGTSLAFLETSRLGALPEGVKLLLIDDSTSSAFATIPNKVTEIAKGKVWHVSSKTANGEFFNRETILDSFMKDVAKEVTITKTIQVPEEYTEMETRTRIEEYIEKETRTREIDVPYKVLEPISIKVVNGLGAEVTGITIEEIGETPTELKIVDGLATFTPTKAGAVKITYTYKHDGIEKTVVKVIAQSEDSVSKEILLTEESVKELPSTGRYEPITIIIPALPSKLTAYDTAYSRDYTVEVNKGSEDAYSISIEGERYLTEKEPIKITTPPTTEKPKEEPKAKPQTTTIVQTKQVKALPKTGDSSSLSLVVAGILSGLSAFGYSRKRKQD